MTRQRIDDDFLSDGAEGIDEDDLEQVLNQADVITTKATQMLSMSAQVMLLLEMLRDYFTGNYTTLPYRIIGGVVFSLLYVLNPIDLVPDIFPGLGFLDDALLVALLLTWASSDIELYRAWRDKNSDRTPVAAPKSTHRNR